MAHTKTIHHATRRLLTTVLAVVGLAGAAEAVAQPNLVVTGVADPPVRVDEGGRMLVRDTTANRGTAARGSATRFYLTTNVARSLRDRRTGTANPRESLADILLSGARQVPALAGGAASATSGSVAVTVPLGTPAGRYRLLACADDRGQVSESAEGDNCRVAVRVVRVVALDTGALLVDAFSSLREKSTDAGDLGSLAGQQAFECTPRPPAKRMPLRRALASTEAWVARTAGPDAMAALAASPESHNAAALEQAAARAVLAERPGAALAAMLQAHRLKPKEASPLENAGVLATAVGLPAEGLAMIEAARLLDDPDPPAMGLSRQAISLASRGHALLNLGRFTEADASLNTALALDPYLTEAARTRAISALCAARVPTDGPAAALPLVRRAKLRPGQVDPPIDERLGQESGLRPVPLPESPTEALRLLPVYDDWQLRRNLAEIKELTVREQATFVPALRPGETRAEWRRRNRVTLRAAEVPLRPENKARDQAYIDMTGRAHDLTLRFWNTTYLGISEQARVECQGRPDAQTCAAARRRALCVPALTMAHGEWLGVMKAAYALGDTEQRAVSRQVSGVAANLADPATHAFGAVVIDRGERAIVDHLIRYAEQWSGLIAAPGHATDCVGTVDPTPADPSVLPAHTPGASTGACPPALKAINASVDLGQAKLRVNCERVQLEASAPVASWIEAFGEVKFDPRAGSVTMIAGAKAKAGAGPLKASFKSGLYVTVSAGGVQDVGWRVGPSMSTGAGPVEFRIDDQMNLSFIGAQATNRLW